MKPIHAILASWLPWVLALVWWCNRDLDPEAFSAIAWPSFESCLLVAVLLVLCWGRIQAGAAAAWRWVRERMPSGSSFMPTVVLAVPLLLVGFAIGWTAGGAWHRPPSPPTPVVDPVVPETPVKVSAAIYVYEKDDGSVPSGVLVALDKINRQGILATAFEEDTVDGSGETPEQYKSALNASKGNRPALVVERGNVSRVLPKVTTESQVMEAVK